MQYCVLTLSVALGISKLTTWQSVFRPKTITLQLINTDTAYCTKPKESLPLSHRKVNLSHSEPVLQSHSLRVIHSILLIRFNIISHIHLDPSRLTYRQKVLHYIIFVKGITLYFATCKDILFFTQMFITESLIQELTTCFGLKYLGNQANRSCINTSIRICNNYWIFQYLYFTVPIFQY